MRRTRGEMTQQRGKKIGLPHPAVAFAAAGLLLGVTFNQMIRPAPRTSGASVPPGGLPPVAAAPPAARSGMAASFAGPPAPALPAGGDEPRTPGADLPALPPAPPSAATSPPALVGPPAPARGPGREVRGGAADRGEREHSSRGEAGRRERREGGSRGREDRRAGGRSGTDPAAGAPEPSAVGIPGRGVGGGAVPGFTARAPARL